MSPTEILTEHSRPTTHDFLSITEIAGDQVTREQVERIAARYFWAAEFCKDKRVLEAACGTGQGLRYLATLSRKAVGGDIMFASLEKAKQFDPAGLTWIQMDAHELPFADQTVDTVLLFEAIYYLERPETFVRECRRILRPGGYVLIVTANKDLYDFNPSPFSQRYFGPPELKELFENENFSVKCWASHPISEVSWRQKILRPLKKAAVDFGFIPKTMEGKKLLKKLIFGGLVTMPHEIKPGTAERPQLESIDPGQPDKRHKVIYCSATLGPM